MLYHSNMVEVQVAFHAIRVGRQEYLFLPKLRAICLLNRVVERVSSRPCRISETFD